MQLCELYRCKIICLWGNIYIVHVLYYQNQFVYNPSQEMCSYQGWKKSNVKKIYINSEETAKKVFKHIMFKRFMKTIHWRKKNPQTFSTNLERLWVEFFLATHNWLYMVFSPSWLPETAKSKVSPLLQERKRVRDAIADRNEFSDNKSKHLCIQARILHPQLDSYQAKPIHETRTQSSFSFQLWYYYTEFLTYFSRMYTTCTIKPGSLWLFWCLV